jgi:predicted flap endonuclease-1-like 5' DNA nuclease
MSSLGCFLWWLVLGGLLGWLASWLFGRRKPEVIERIVDRPVDRIVEKIVDRPVDRIVEKVVEKTIDRPVDRVVEKLVDNPMHLSKIATLSAEVATIAGLKMTIDQMRAAPPKTIEKIVEKIVDRPVEKIVEKIVDRPVEKIVEKIVDRPVDRVVEKIVEKIVDRPVDRIVEKMVDNPSHLSKIATLSAEVAGIAALKMTIDQLRSAPPKVVEKIIDRPVEKIVEKIVDRPVDRIVEKMVDNPAHLSKIATLSAEVATIAGLKMTIDQMRNAPPKVVEKIVEKIVDRPVEKIVEKIVDRPVDRVVEKIVEKIVDRPVDRIVEKLVDNPAHLSRIAALTAEVATIAGFKTTIEQLRNAPPKTVEKIVEKIVDRPVDRIVEKTVEKLVDNPAHLARIKALEAELAVFSRHNVQVDKVAAKAAGFTVRGMDDLEIIEGIGPKIAGLFHDAGIHMFWELEQTPIARMQEILDAAGPNYRLANPASWAKQSGLAADNKWAELRKLQDELTAGVKK